VDQLGDVDAEQVDAGLVAGAEPLEQGRVVDLDRPAGQLGVAGPGGRVVGRVVRGAVESQPGVAAEVEGLGRVYVRPVTASPTAPAREWSGRRSLATAATRKAEAAIDRPVRRALARFQGGS
jgi:hypothetical protein